MHAVEAPDKCCKRFKDLLPYLGGTARCNPGGLYQTGAETKDALHYKRAGAVYDAFDGGDNDDDAQSALSTTQHNENEGKKEPERNDHNRDVSLMRRGSLSPAVSTTPKHLGQHQ